MFHISGKVKEHPILMVTQFGLLIYMYIHHHFKMTIFDVCLNVEYGQHISPSQNPTENVA